MSNSKNIFLSLLSVLILISLTGYLTFFVNNTYKKNVPEYIEVDGSSLISGNDYLVFAKLEKRELLKRLPESVIKDRLEKHPYIRRADIANDGINKLKVSATEKNIKAVLIMNSEPFLISDEYQVLPLFPNINSIDVPVINILNSDEAAEPLAYMKNAKIMQAFKIIDAFKALDSKETFKSLSEINFNSGLTQVYPNEPVVTFSGLSPLVVFGIGEEARKVLTVQTMLKAVLSGAVQIERNSYMDVRYAGKVYFGSINNAGSVQ